MEGHSLDPVIPRLRWRSEILIVLFVCRRGGQEDHSEDAQAFICRKTKDEQGFEEIVMDYYGVIFFCENRNKFLMVQKELYFIKG